MKQNKIIYWITTILVAFVLLSGGAAYLARVPATVTGMAKLGYPPYFITILGVWKVLGGIVLLAPRLPRLKEWAYAGTVFDLTGASASHLSIGDPTIKVIVPLVITLIAFASWYSRPASRRL
jgi:uncharacterized membrane protein YphA (DoxX/SURF4 family)